MTSVNKVEANSWQDRAVVATISASVITLVACSILAILNNYGMISMPAALSTTNLLLIGVGSGVFFAVLALIIKYACNKKANTDPNDQNNNDGASPLNPNGKGNSGAPGGPAHQSNLRVHQGEWIDPLSENSQF